MTFALRRRFPAPWLRELRTALDDIGLRYEADGLDAKPLVPAAVELTVWADEEQAKELKQWCADHGDDILQVFGAKRHRFDQPKKRYLLKAGEEKQMPLNELNNELTGGSVVMSTLVLVDDVLTFEVEEDRLVPDSGLMGKMGRFRATVTIEGVTKIDDHDAASGYFPATYSHYDPACRRFSIGSPPFGGFYIKTPNDTAVVQLSNRPTHVRRWRKWVESPGSHS